MWRCEIVVNMRKRMSLCLHVMCCDVIRAPTQSGKQRAHVQASRGPSGWTDFTSFRWAPRGRRSQRLTVIDIRISNSSDRASPTLSVVVVAEFETLLYCCGCCFLRGPGAPFLEHDFALGLVRRVPSQPLLSLRGVLWAVCNHSAPTKKPPSGVSCTGGRSAGNLTQAHPRAREEVPVGLGSH